MFRGNHPDVRHQLAGMPEAPQVAEFGDERHGRDERHAA
jgi:hypothetical protein